MTDVSRDEFRELHKDVKELSKKVDDVLAWQNQFKGGLRLIIWFVSLAGTAAGLTGFFHKKP